MPSRSSGTSFPPAEDQNALLRRLREWALAGSGLASNNRLGAYVTVQMLKDAGILVVRENYQPGEGMGFQGVLSLGIVKAESIAAQACSFTLTNTGRPAQVTATAVKGDQALEIDCWTGLNSGGTPMAGTLVINGTTIGTFAGNYQHTILNPSGSYTIAVNAGSGTPADNFKLRVHLARR